LGAIRASYVISRFFGSVLVIRTTCGEKGAALTVAADASGLIVGHYERHARLWDADRRESTWYDKPWHERFVAALPKRATVLDLGCGGGAPVALHLAKSGLRITGIDTSPSLIALCRERMPG